MNSLPVLICSSPAEIFRGGGGGRLGSSHCRTSISSAHVRCTFQLGQVGIVPPHILQIDNLHDAMVMASEPLIAS